MVRSETFFMLLRKTPTKKTGDKQRTLFSNFHQFIGAENTPKDTHKTRKPLFPQLGNTKKSIFEIYFCHFFRESLTVPKKVFQLAKLLNYFFSRNETKEKRRPQNIERQIAMNSEWHLETSKNAISCLTMARNRSFLRLLTSLYPARLNAHPRTKANTDPEAAITPRISTLRLRLSEKQQN